MCLRPGQSGIPARPGLDMRTGTYGCGSAPESVPASPNCWASNKPWDHMTRASVKATRCRIGHAALGRPGQQAEGPRRVAAIRHADTSCCCTRMARPPYIVLDAAGSRPSSRRSSGNRESGGSVRRRIRNCPAAVSGNESRQQHWTRRSGKRRPVGEYQTLMPTSPKTCQRTTVSPTVVVRDGPVGGLATTRTLAGACVRRSLLGRRGPDPCQLARREQ